MARTRAGTLKCTVSSTAASRVLLTASSRPRRGTDTSHGPKDAVAGEVAIRGGADASADRSIRRRDIAG